jgi:hypothetical protein
MSSRMSPFRSFAIAFATLSVGLIAHGYQQQQCNAYVGDEPPADEYERLEKFQSAIRVNPWSLFDNRREYADRYIDTVGYVAQFSGSPYVYLVPSKEYGEFFLPQYALALDKDCLRSVGVHAGDHINLVGKMERGNGSPTHSGEATMSEILHVRALRYPQ